jgi:hypothetical protein
VEPWSLDRYRRPRLGVDTIGRDNGGRVVTLTAGNTVYRLECDTVAGADRIAADLLQLRDPGAPLWHVVRSSDVESGWGVLGTFLDARSLISEADGVEIASTVTAQSVVDRTMRAALATLEGVGPKTRARIRANAAGFLESAGYRPSDGSFAGAAADLAAASRHDNFFLGLLGLEFSYMRRCAPVAMWASTLLLCEIAGHPGGGSDAWRERVALELGWLYEERDFDAHLTLVAYCIVQSAGEVTTRFPAPELPTLASAAGLEFMRRAELLTREALAQWGSNRYVAATAALRDIESPLVAGCFIEEYHVTRRFVEIITPMLRKRLSDPLRVLMFRYYSEEIGHEEFERATCESLGVAGRNLDRAIPLPLHFAFVDALTEAAEQDPICFFAVIMVTEGMLGDPSVLSDRLAEAGRRHRKFRKVSQRHDQLNQDLHHASIARLAFEHVGPIGPDRQQRALRWLLFLLELNHRAWDGVADFYGPQSTLRMHGFLGVPWTPEA